MEFMTTSCWLFYLLITPKSQRITLTSTWTFTYKISYTLANGTVVTPPDSVGINVADAKCPAGSSCVRFNNYNGVATVMNVEGYRDIQIGYDIRTTGLESDQFCNVGWVPLDGTAAVLADHIANEAPEHVLYTVNNTLLSAISVDNQRVAVDFTAMFSKADAWCYVNNMVVTGLEITTTTNHPSVSPTTKQPTNTETPSNTPSSNPTEALHETLTSKVPTLFIHLTPNPSISPSVLPSVHQRQPSLDTQTSTTSAALQEQDDAWKLIIVVVMACIVLICVVCFGGFAFLKSTQKEIEGKIEKDAVEMIDNEAGLQLQVTDEGMNAENIHNATAAMDVQSKEDKNTLQVQNWLTDVVKLPQYFNVFMSNGYETMKIVKEIRNTGELAEIGILSKVHQMRILLEIENWRKGNVLVTNLKTHGSVWDKGERRTETAGVRWNNSQNQNINIGNDAETITEYI